MDASMVLQERVAWAWVKGAACTVRAQAAFPTRTGGTREMEKTEKKLESIEGEIFEIKAQLVDLVEQVRQIEMHLRKLSQR